MFAIETLQAKNLLEASSPRWSFPCCTVRSSARNPALPGQLTVSGPTVVCEQRVGLIQDWGVQSWGYLNVPTWLGIYTECVIFCYLSSTRTTNANVWLGITWHYLRLAWSHRIDNFNGWFGWGSKTYRTDCVDCVGVLLVLTSSTPTQSKHR